MPDKKSGKKSIREIQKLRGDEFIKSSVYMGSNKTKCQLLLDRAMYTAGKQIIPQYPKQTELSDEEFNEHLRIVCSFNRNLQSADNISMPINMISRIAEESIDDIKKECTYIMNTIDNFEDFSIFSKGYLFYKNFPEEVMSKSDFELYRNALIYYTANIGLGINGFSEDMRNAGLMDKVKNSKSPLLEVYARPMKYLTLATNDDLKQLMYNRMHGIGMSISKRDELFAYAALMGPEKFEALVSGKYSSKENEALIASWFHDHGHDDVVYRAGLCKNARDILRVISVISLKNGASNGVRAHSAGIIKTIEYPEKLYTPKSFDVRFDRNKKDIEFIKTLMNNASNIYVDVWNDKNFWKKVMRNIDAKHGPTRVVKLFDNLASNTKVDERCEPILSDVAKLDRAIDSLNHNDPTPLRKIVANTPGKFLRNCISVMQKANNKEAKKEVGSLIASAAIQKDPMDALKLANYATTRNTIDQRYVILPTGAIHQEKQAKSLDAYDADLIKNTIQNAMKSTLSGSKDLGKVYIDPTLKNCIIPQRSDIASSTGTSYGTGTILNANKGKDIVILGIHWTNSTAQPRTDIDLHAIAVKNLTNMDDHIDIGFRDLVSSFACHSGDITEGDPSGDGSGSEELIAIDKQAMKDAGYRYIIADIHNFNGDFKDNHTVKFIYMEKEKAEKYMMFDEATLEKCSSGHPLYMGETIEPSQFEQSINIDATGDTNIPIVYDVVKDQYIWIDKMFHNSHVIPSRGQECSEKYQTMSEYSNQKHFNAMALMIDSAINTYAPSMYQLFSLYAPSQDIVDSIDKADTIFTMKPIDKTAELTDKTIICAAETDKIAKEFCTLSVCANKEHLAPVQEVKSTDTIMEEANKCHHHHAHDDHEER